MGFVVGWGGEIVWFSFFKNDRLAFCLFLCVCVFYPALSYKSHLSRCIPVYFQDIAHGMRVQCVYPCVFFCPHHPSPPEFTFSSYISCLLLFKCFEGLELTCEYITTPPVACLHHVFSLTCYVTPENMLSRYWNKAVWVRSRPSRPVSNTL